MTGLNAEELFYRRVTEIKMGRATGAETADECLELLRAMYGEPMYPVGELNFALNKCMDELHRATGESLESLVMKVGITKPIRWLFKYIPV